MQAPQVWHWNNVPMQHAVHGMQPMVLVNSPMAYEGAPRHSRPKSHPRALRRLATAATPKLDPDIRAQFPVRLVSRCRAVLWARSCAG